MAYQTKVVSLFYIYLMLSVDPIQAARVKATSHLVKKAEESQELVRELQKALNENHMEELFVQNATSLYIGETWASCLQRKKDFERRSMEMKKLYEDSQADGTTSTIESGWIILKARSLSITVSTASKQGCEWLQNQDVDMKPLKALMNETSQFVPCREAARASLESVKGEPTEDDVTNAMSILFSNDCKPHNSIETTENIEMEEVLDAEEKEEEATEQLVADFKAQRKGAEGITSFLQKVSDQAVNGAMIVVPGIVATLVGFIMAVLVCMVSLALFVLIFGVIYCLLRFIVSKLLRMMDFQAPSKDGLPTKVVDNFENCADRWIRWMKTHNGQDAVKVGAFCLLSTLLGFTTGVLNPAVQPMAIPTPPVVVPPVLAPGNWGR